MILQRHIPSIVAILCGAVSTATLVLHQGEATGESGDEPTVLLITYAGTPGVPRGRLNISIEM